MRVLAVIFALASASLVSGSALGASVTSGVKPYTVSGSSYAFSLAAAPAAVGSGVLTFDGVGDFNEASEFVTVTINGSSFIASRFAAGPGITTSYTVTGVQSPVYPEIKLDKMKVQFSLSAATINALRALTMDGTLNFLVKFQRNVSAPGAGNRLASGSSFSTTSLYYEVPEPASMSILALGGCLIGMARLRKRK